MISSQDMVTRTGLTEAEIAVVGEPEQVGEIAAAATMEVYLMNRLAGPRLVQGMICEDIRAALHEHRLGHARELYAALRHFVATHPEAANGVDHSDFQSNGIIR